MTALARFHAAWWDDPRLGASVGVRPDAAVLDRYRQQLASHYARFADPLGEDRPPARRDLYERVLEAGPRLFKRTVEHRNATLIHGDAHVWNSFLPRDGSEDVRMFDWDGWRINIAATDFA